MQDSFKWIVKKGSSYLPFSVTEDYGMGKGLLYCPHPFTNWSLNPSYCNDKGEANHTIEGFRKTQETNSIIKMVQEHPTAYKIVCVGGSTTYCSGVFRYQETWPSLLNYKLKEQDVIVFNFGVSGWGILQSIIRCSTWLPLVRPNLVIMYQAKNELTPFYIATENEDKIHPDYQNVMGQFSEQFFLKFPKWVLYIPFFSLVEMRRLHRENFYSVYMKPAQWLSYEGFQRFNSEMLKGALFRIEALINMCKMLDCKFLYIPEIVRGSPYADRMEEIYVQVPSIISKYDNGYFFDIRPFMPTSDEYYQDKSHFSEKGCDIFSEILSTQVTRIMKT